MAGWLPLVSLPYTGPGDLVAGAAGWWGLRAYTLASIGSNCVDVIRASDSTTQTFVTVAGGGLNISSISTFLSSTTGKVSKLWDQSGNGIHMLQATGAAQPTFTLSGIGSLPVLTFSGSQWLAASGNTGVSYPSWVSYVAKRTGNTSAFNSILKHSTAGGNVGFANSLNTAYLFTGSTVLTATANDNTVHAIQNLLIDTPANGDLYIDGADNSLASATALAMSGNIEISGDGGGQNLTGIFMETGIWAGNKTSSNSAMNSNQHTYWGF